jgi:hypothetical protein
VNISNPLVNLIDNDGNETTYKNIDSVSLAELTTGGLNSSLRSGKLQRKRVREVSMGSRRITDEFRLIFLKSLICDAG